MHWETRKFIGLALLWYLLYCSVLGLHSQRLRGVPAESASFGNVRDISPSPAESTSASL